MRKITSFILALALTLSLLVTAGAADPGKVDLVITPTLGEKGHVFFAVDLKPSGKDPITVGAFQFAVTVEGGTIVADSPNTALLYDDKTHPTGYFEQFGGGIISEGKYKFVAAGTIPNDSTIKDVNGNTTTIPARIWKMTAQTPIVTLEVQMAEDVKSCQLVVDTTSDSRFSVGSSVLKDGKYTVQETCTGTATSTLYTPASPTGVTVRGKIKSYNPGNQVTIRLLQGKGEKYKTTIAANTGSGQVPQNFSIANVAPGTYDLEVTKAAHLKYTIKNVVVPSSDLNLTTHSNPAISTITLLVGDVDQDGMINYMDLFTMLDTANYDMRAGSAQNKLVDIDGDGMVNYMDLFMLLDSNNYDHSESDCKFNYQ